MGPTWGRQDPGGPHVGPMSFAFWEAATAIGNAGFMFHTHPLHGAPYDWDFIIQNVNILCVKSVRLCISVPLTFLWVCIHFVKNSNARSLMPRRKMYWHRSFSKWICRKISFKVNECKGQGHSLYEIPGCFDWTAPISLIIASDATTNAL